MVAVVGVKIKTIPELPRLMQRRKSGEVQERPAAERRGVRSVIHHIRAVS